MFTYTVVKTGNKVKQTIVNIRINIIFESEIRFLNVFIIRTSIVFVPRRRSVLVFCWLPRLRSVGLEMEVQDSSLRLEPNRRIHRVL